MTLRDKHGHKVEYGDKVLVATKIREAFTTYAWGEVIGFVPSDECWPMVVVGDPLDSGSTRLASLAHVTVIHRTPDLAHDIDAGDDE